MCVYPLCLASSPPSFLVLCWTDSISRLIASRLALAIANHVATGIVSFLCLASIHFLFFEHLVLLWNLSAFRSFSHSLASINIFHCHCSIEAYQTEREREIERRERERKSIQTDHTHTHSHTTDYCHLISFGLIHDQHCAGIGLRSSSKWWASWRPRRPMINWTA